MLARYLGPADFGIYSLAVSYGLIFGLLSNLGLDPVIVREVARDQEKTGLYFSHSILLKLGAGIISILFISLVTRFIGYPEETTSAILIFSMVLLVMPLNASQKAVFQARQKMGYLALMKSLSPVINFTLVLGMMWAGFQVQWILGIHFISGLIIFIVFYIFVFKPEFSSFKWPETSKLFIPLIQNAAPFILNGIVYVINARFDVLILSILVGVEAVGLYNAANELIMVLLMIPTTVSTVLFPVFSAEFKKSENRLAEMGSFSFKVINNIGIPAGAGLFILAPEIIPFLFGSEYSGSVQVLQILSITVLVMFPKSILSWLMTSIDKVKVLLWINISSLLLNVLLNFLLIPVMGYAGAAMATVTAMGVSYALILGVLTQELKEVHFLGIYGRPLIAAGIMVGVVILTGHLPLFVKIGIGILVYVCSAMIVSVFTKNELALIKKSISARGY